MYKHKEKVSTRDDEVTDRNLRLRGTITIWVLTHVFFGAPTVKSFARSRVDLDNREEEDKKKQKVVLN